MLFCRSCKSDKEKICFRKCRKHKSGYDTICKGCHNEVTKKYRSTPRGKALNAWTGIASRAENKNGKNPSYQDIKINMSKEEFLEWAIPEYLKWSQESPNLIPSVDRIDSKGHYSVDNIRLLSISENCARSRKENLVISGVNNYDDKAELISALANLVLATCCRNDIKLDDFMKEFRGVGKLG